MGSATRRARTDCLARLRGLLTPEQVGLAIDAVEAPEARRDEARRLFERSIEPETTEALRDVFTSPGAPRFAEMVEERYWEIQRESSSSGPAYPNKRS